MSDDKVSSNEAIDAAMRLDGDPENLRDYYDEWARNYDFDTGSVDYNAPAICVRLLRGYLAERDAQLLDAGCGTGLVGIELGKVGYRRIDGFDLSEVMTGQARERGVYRELKGGIDMMQAARHYPDARYDAVLSAGVFTLGHVPPEALAVLLQLIRPGGLLLLSTRTHYYDQTGFQALVDNLIESGEIELLKLVRDALYNKDGGAHYWVFKKSG